jgi:hypothetical protein
MGFMQEVLAQITDAAMPEIEHHCNAIRAVQYNDDEQVFECGKVKQPVSQLLPDDLKSSLPTVEEIEAELMGVDDTK